MKHISSVTPLVVLQTKTLWWVVKNTGQFGFGAYLGAIFEICPHVASGGMVSQL